MNTKENGGGLNPKDVTVSWHFAPAYQKVRETLCEKLKPWASQLLDSTYDRALRSLDENVDLAYVGDCQFSCTSVHHKGERVDLMSFILADRRGGLRHASIFAGPSSFIAESKTRLLRDLEETALKTGKGNLFIQDCK
jgi:hypothetical protein